MGFPAKRKLAAAIAAAVTTSILLASTASATALSVEPVLDLQGQGLSIAEGGVGLETLSTTGPKNLTITIGGPVEKAILYWAGRELSGCPSGSCFPSPPPHLGDQQLVFDGTSITGQITGTEIEESRGQIGYAADVTSTVAAKGTGTYTIADGDTNNNLDRLDGAGLIVVFRDPSSTTFYRVMIADGLDFAYGPSLGTAENRVTSPVDFLYKPSSSARTAELSLFVGDSEPTRPDQVHISDNPILVNTLGGSDGRSWDTDTHSITIPATKDRTTVQVVSPPDQTNPDSLLWVLAALRVPLPAGLQGCTPGYWKNHLSAWTSTTSFSPSQTVGSVFTGAGALGSATLEQALRFPGGSGTIGGARILLRASVAALLNAGHPSLNYPRSVGQVVTAVNSALATNNRNTMLTLASALDADNNLGCPLR